MTQKENILRHLQLHGEINVLQALRRYGCYRLSARILELRGEGHIIDYVREKDRKKNRYVYRWQK